MLGLLSLYFDKPLILINRQLDKQTKQMVCGYALGHYLEHQLLMGDANYFSRMFRKVEGISPREYRKQW